MILINIVGLKEWKPLSNSKGFHAFVQHFVGKPRVLEEIERNFVMWVLSEFKRNIQARVKAQSFPVKYEPLNAAYKAQKQKQKLNTGFWVATGFLMEHLKVWRYGNKYTIGFDSKVKHPENGELLVEIVKRLELGCVKTNLPARPLFLPIAKSYGKHMYANFERFIKFRYPNYYPLLSQQVGKEDKK
jgi:hypothetical protein